MSDAADTVVLLDANGNPTDGVEITSSSQTVTLQYTGEKYTYPDGADTFTYTLSAEYATSAEVVPYTVGRDGGAETYATVGDGASAMTVVVYYEGGSDTHADSTITVTNEAGGSVLAVGTNTISATSVCKTSSGSNVAVSDITVTITASGDNYIYNVSGENYTGVYNYTLDSEGAVVRTGQFFEGTKTGSTDVVFAVYSDGLFLIGSQTQAETYAGSANGGTTGYWGYDENDDLVFVRVSTAYGSDDDGNVTMTDTYYVCVMETGEDGSVTISDSNGTAVTGTIPDISVITGEGYDLSDFELIYPTSAE